IAKPCWNVNGAAKNSHHERRAIIPLKREIKAQQTYPPTVNFISFFPLI
ncbi:unnamed protein product, partial [Brassica rapa]